MESGSKQCNVSLQSRGKLHMGCSQENRLNTVLPNVMRVREGQVFAQPGPCSAFHPRCSSGLETKPIFLTGHELNSCSWFPGSLSFCQQSHIETIKLLALRISSRGIFFSHKAIVWYFFSGTHKFSKHRAPTSIKGRSHLKPQVPVIAMLLVTGTSSMLTLCQSSPGHSSSNKQHGKS